MKLNERKTKCMLINFSRKNKFTTDLKLKGESLEIVDEARLLGVILTSDLKWAANTLKLLGMQIYRVIKRSCEIVNASESH